MHRILIINRCNTDNLGDQIIAQSMKTLFSSPNTKVYHADYVFNPKKKPTNGMLSRYLWIVAKIVYYFRCIYRIIQCDTFIIGGGELLSPNGAFWSSFVRWNRLITTLKKKPKQYLFSVGASGCFAKEQSTILREFLSRYRGIYIRDTASYDYVKAILEGVSCSIKTIPDSVFALSLCTKNQSGGCVCGITSLARHNKHGLLPFASERDMHKFYEAIVCQEAGESPVRLIYNNDEDYKATIAFATYMENAYRHEKVVIQDINDTDQLIAVIQGANKVISPRMHSCILAMCMSKQVVPIVLSDKMKVFSDMYIGKGVDISCLADEVRNAVEEIMLTLG